MHIKKVRIHGFKSFCDKTLLSFERDLSGVVGPNGCGKSNVFDAVKWCLGEQSAKSLRGSAMSDVIFNGSKNRPPSSSAEVAITFSKGAKAFPPPYHICDEIEIARILHRKGGSEYLINKVRVRLKDIQDLFLDTGLHNRLYSFIEQGQIGMIVNARPAQTRLLFEEAAGISRFKLRKEQSMDRLKKVSSQLSEIDIMLDVQKKQLDTLQKQVQQAAKYKRILREERELYLFGLLALGNNIAQKLEARKEKYKTFETEITEKELVNTRQEAFLHQARVGHSALFQRLSEVRTRYATVEKELGELRLRLELSSKELEEKKKSRIALRASIKEEKQELSKEEAALRTASAQRQAIWQSIQGEKTEIGEQRAILKERKKEIHKKYALLEKKKEEQRVCTKDIASASSQMNSIGMLLIRIKNEQKEREREQKNWILEYKKIGEERARLLVENDHLHVQKEGLKAKEQKEQENIRLHGVERAQYQKERKAIEKQHKELQKKQDTRKTEVSTLLRMQRDRVGFSNVIQKLLRNPGVQGTMLEGLDVPEQYESILAMALGEYLEAVLVSREETLFEIVGKTEGRVHCFVPANLPSYREEGLLEFITGTEDSKKVLSSILGVHRLYQDWEQIPKDPNETSLCLNPLCVVSQGRLTVGKPKSDSLLILERSRSLKIKKEEIDKNELVLEKYLAQIAELERREAQGEERLRKCKISKAEIQQERQEIEKKIIRITAEMRSLEKEEKAMKRRQEKLATDQRRVITEIEGQKQKREQCTKRKMELEKELFFLEDRIRELQGELQNIQKEQREREKSLQKRDTEYQIVQEKLHSKEELEKRLRRTCERLHSSMMQKKEKVEAVDTRILGIMDVLEKEKGREDLLADSCQSLSKKSSSMETSYQEKQLEYSQVEKEFRVQIADMEKQKGELQRKEDEINRLKQEKSEVANHLQSELSIQLEEELFLLHRDTQRAFCLDEEIEYIVRLDDILSKKLCVENQHHHTQKKKQITGMRGINHLAIEQHAVLDAEYALKTEQRKDIFESVSSLEAFILELDQKCVERFSKTYKNVNAHFQEMYPQLVGGGKSYLELEDPSDLLNTGVHIYARPPGKRMQQLSLLSGGEKAMVAISLLFSLFKEKPSPFCLLDEVDAPLDEGNGARFNMMLKEMALTSQFIVITHNKKTMEAMDVLYGVSMPKPGVSQVGSVRLR